MGVRSLVDRTGLGDLDLAGDLDLGLGSLDLERLDKASLLDTGSLDLDLLDKGSLDLDLLGGKGSLDLERGSL